MLYILPPLRSQNPPAPWSNLICTNGNNRNSGNLDNSSTGWKNNNSKPPKIQLRNLQILPKRDDESSEFHDTLDANRNSKRPQSWGSRSIVFRTYSEKPDLEELHGLFKVELEVDDSSMILVFSSSESLRFGVDADEMTQRQKGNVILTSS
ncbi:hypothetical protein HUJ05_007935 [Dendroctonus ponderosae]|nr:hypothetical protein HUJ05_007935 [Dendroctonus ponderosae]